MGDDWRPTASIDCLARRAALLRVVRRFFEERDVCEVETPVMAAAGVTDVNLEGLSVAYTAPGGPTDGRLWLQTSPEYAMKRLLAAGMGAIYQISRAFRAGERGRLHNPEFSLLEWYRPGFDHQALMAEIADLVVALLPARPVERRTYRQVFQACLAVDPLTVGDNELRALAARHGNGLDVSGLNRDALLDVLMSHAVSPGLGREAFTFVTHFPASQAALARLSPDDPRVAERFELFIDGIEIANGFHELTDAAEQRARFEADRARRAAAGLAQPSVDERLLGALQAGLPPCAGVALGLDRLFMLALGAERIDEVIAFPVERA